MNIHIIAFGKLKEEYLSRAQAEYVKRIGAYAALKITELPEEKLPEKPSAAEIEAALAAEAARAEKLLSARALTFALCIEGKQISSPAFSAKLTDAAVAGISTVNFLIGSSFGLHEGIKSRAGFRLSMSEMTFPHQLARILLLEQVYRAYQIAAGGKYHK